MKAVVFFSWQSDTPRSTNQDFIQRALELAAGELASAGSIEVDVAIDRDTIGVPGAPDIGATIFTKIDASDVFVADVTLINSAQAGRHVPNPNVLVELGYALRAIGSSRVLLVQNEAYGPPESLPFDLRFRKTLVYRSSDDADALVQQRETLTASLRRELELILRNASAPVRRLTKEEKWLELLRTAHAKRTYVKIDSPIQIEFATPDVSGNPVRQHTRTDGLMLIESVDEDAFVVSIPFPGASTHHVRIPFGQTEDLWLADGFLHVMLRRAIVRGPDGTNLR